MRSLLMLFLVFSVSLTSCQDVKRLKKPDDLIPKDKMVDVLVELSLLQGAKSANQSMFERTGMNHGKYIWERFGIDSLQFVNSSNYYADNYSEYEEIYLNVQSRLEKYKVRYDSLREIEQKKQDSLKALDPKDSLERARETRFRDSILEISIEEGTVLPAPISQE